MSAARLGRNVSPNVIVLLGVLAERTNAVTGIARPGYATIAADTGWSPDTIARTVVLAERLGAIDVTHFRGRGRATEFRFTEAVLGAPNLDLFAAHDRDKTPQASGLFLVDKTPQPCGLLPSEETPHNCGLSGSNTDEKTPQRCDKNPANLREKPRSPAAPTVGSTVGSTERKETLDAFVARMDVPTSLETAISRRVR